MITAYRLPLDQRERLREAGGPLEQVDLSKMAPEALPVVEVDGRIVAYWPVFYALHVEPLWIAESHRTNPAVARALLDQLTDELSLLREPVSFAVIDPAAPSLPLAERLGFARVPGDLYYVLTPALTPVGG